MNQVKWIAKRTAHGVAVATGLSEDTSKETYIRRAIRNNDMDEFKELVTKKNGRANIQLDMLNLKPLHYVCTRDADRVDFAEHLLETGANMNASYMGNKPIHIASTKEHPKLIQYLIQKGANYNEKSSDGNTPLSISAERGLVENVRVLLQNGVDVNEKSSDGYTPIQLVFADQKIPIEKNKK